MMLKFETSKIWRHEHGNLHAKIEISRDQIQFYNGISAKTSLIPYYFHLLAFNLCYTFHL